MLGGESNTSVPTKISQQLGLPLDLMQTSMVHRGWILMMFVIPWLLVIPLYSKSFTFFCALKLLQPLCSYQDECKIALKELLKCDLLVVLLWHIQWLNAVFEGCSPWFESQLMSWRPILASLPILTSQDRGLHRELVLSALRTCREQDPPVLVPIQAMTDQGQLLIPVVMVKAYT